MSEARPAAHEQENRVALATEQDMMDMFGEVPEIWASDEAISKGQGKVYIAHYIRGTSKENGEGSNTKIALVLDNYQAIHQTSRYPVIERDRTRLRNGRRVKVRVQIPFPRFLDWGFHGSECEYRSEFGAGYERLEPIRHRQILEDQGFSQVKLTVKGNKPHYVELSQAEAKAFAERQKNRLKEGMGYRR